MNKHLLTHIPQGTKDFLPVEARQKRRMETLWADLFEKWSYDEVVTPTMEYLETMAIGSTEDQQEHMYKFVDKANRIIVLRTDMTTPIARVAATRLKDTPAPLRLFYLANVFRYEQVQAGRQCEFYQAGVELLGCPGPMADAEVIALAIEALKQSGLSQFQVSLGNVEFINAVMEESGLAALRSQQVKQALLTRNFVQLEEVLANSKLTQKKQDFIAGLPMLQGGREVLDKARAQVTSQRSLQALDAVEHIYGLLCHYGVEDYVNIDLGVVRDLDYYTGMVFEIYTAGLGFPVCGGGRYDNLITQYGVEYPATGFAIGLERVLLALERQGIETAKQGDTSRYVTYASGLAAKAIDKVLQLRKQGIVAELDILERDIQAGREYAVKSGLAWERCE